jgi:hypothetical protein
VWKSLPAQRVFAYERMCVWDAGGEPRGKGSLSFDCAEIGEPNLGYIVEGRALQWQCLQGARSAGAVLLEAGLGAIVTAESDVSVRLNDGRELRSQLLIAADGPESKPPVIPIIKTRWWRIYALPSPIAAPLGSDSSAPDPWLCYRCRTAARPSCGAPRFPRRRGCSRWGLRLSAPR